ncbi:hypothetical protein ACFVAJ_18050 [Agromyces sp. NPDC057679]|uniref:hypothetical protein n=1 Tax=Agromyces sp. NPDC057679 TaxID=3346207 RepID=UPI00366B7CD9
MPPSARIAAITALTAGTLALTGCVAVELPGQTATPEPAVHDLDLSFAGGAALPDNATPELVDTIAGDDGWMLNGTYTGVRAYTDPTGQCVVTVHNGSVPASVTVDEDDRATTDRYLAHLYSAPEPKITKAAKDVNVPYGDGAAQYRQVSGGDPDGAHWATIARVFASVNVTTFADLDCQPGADADAALAYVTTHLNVE